MAQFLRSLRQDTNAISSSLAPYNELGGRPLPNIFQRGLDDLSNLMQRGSPILPSDIPAILDAAKNMNTVGIDDRKFLLEKLLVFMSRCPDDSEISKKVQELVIEILYNDLPHPPASYLTVPSLVPTPSLSSNNGVTYAYREADGSSYNVLFPTLGRAGQPYARTVSSIATLPRPDAGLVFDTLLRQEGGFQAHPGGLSSLFFSFADLVIHSIFNTNPRDWMINKASSYLDLSPLYGNSNEEVDTVRRKDGTGRLWNDVFADGRILLMPPNVGALLLLFNRNHNFIAERILQINERGNLKDPSTLQGKETELLKQDDEIFQRARLVNTGFFMQIILCDYVGAILGMIRDGLSWRLNPRGNMRESNHEVAPLGQGNVCSIEFNLMYRWHATLSKDDTKWTEDVFREMFPGKDFNNLSGKDFAQAAMQKLRNEGGVREWQIAGLTRQADGSFKDEDLANIIINATESPAAAFRARGIPEVMRVIEVLAIEQARSWGACSLNEFRSFMGLRPYSNFKEWNPRPEIYTAAEALYHHIDNLELHVGLQAEECKVPMPGAGLCPPYTISRAILSDAVNLIRGDRFLTLDFTPFNLTSWGYDYCQVDPNDGSYGSILPRMLANTLPGYYTTDSAYLRFPFMVPTFMENEMKKRRDPNISMYTFTKPPKPQPFEKVASYREVSYILSRPNEYIDPAVKRTEDLFPSVTSGYELIQSALSLDVRKWRKIISSNTRKLIVDKSVEHVGSDKRYVDIVKDVINLVPVHLLADEIFGLSLKTEDHQRGIYREHELYEMLANISSYVADDISVSEAWLVRERARRIVDMLVEHVNAQLARITKSHLSVSSITEGVVQILTAPSDYSREFLEGLLKQNERFASNTRQTASLLVATLAPGVGQFCLALTHVIDFYLDDSQQAARQQIQQLSGQTSKEADEKLLQYIYNALSLSPPVPGVYRTAKNTKDNIFASIAKANNEKNNGKSIANLTWNDVLLGWIPHGLLSPEFFNLASVEIIRAVFSLKNLERGPGSSGQLKQFEQDVYGTTEIKYIDLQGKVSYWPQSLILQYDE